MIGSKDWPDENASPGFYLPDREFVDTREAILLLLPRLFPDGSCRYADMDIMERIIDETVTDIGNIWSQNEL